MILRCFLAVAVFLSLSPALAGSLPLPATMPGWIDALMPPDSDQATLTTNGYEPFYKRLDPKIPGQDTGLLANYQYNNVVQNTDALPVPLNGWLSPSNIRLTIFIPPGGSYGSVSAFHNFSNTDLWPSAFFTTLEASYYIGNNDISNTAGYNGRFWPIDSTSRLENKKACAERVYWVLNGLGRAPMFLGALQIGITIDNTTSYNQWLDAGKPVCGQTVTPTTTTPTTTVFKVTAPASITAGQSFLLTTSGSLQACTP